MFEEVTGAAGFIDSATAQDTSITGNSATRAALNDMTPKGVKYLQLPTPLYGYMENF